MLQFKTGWRFLAIILLYGNLVTAQTGKSWPVKVGEIPNQVLPIEAMYVLPNFTTGTAFLRDGTSSIQRFNYNYLQDEMQFINEKGDTLTIADPALLKSVEIDSMVFYYDQIFVREIFTAGKYKLAIRQEMVQIADKTRGAYDAASGASSIKTYGSINNENSRIYQLQVKKDVLFEGVHSYYIISADNPFLKATRKNFQLLFEDKSLSKFIKANHINFNKSEDLKTLLKYCTE
jgi:hypothetical protein